MDDHPPTMRRGPITMVSVLVVVEDDPDIQFLIETVFAMDSRFALAGVATAAEDAMDMARTTEPAIIVLDHGLAGQLTGLEAAPRLKELAPQAKTILFTAHAELREPAELEPAIDAFLLKTESLALLPLAVQLIGMDPPSEEGAADGLDGEPPDVRSG